MTQEKEELLIQKFPKIFSDLLEIRKEKQSVMYPIMFGCEIEDGWFKLLYHLLTDIQNYIDDNNIGQVVAEQIKEKWGSLRFYYRGGDDIIDGMVWNAEHLSYYICQDCGTMENVGHTKGWITAYCKNCVPENRKENWVEFEYK